MILSRKDEEGETSSQVIKGEAGLHTVMYGSIKVFKQERPVGLLGK